MLKKIRDFIAFKIIRLFVRKGHVLLLWRDIDDNIEGWHLNDGKYSGEMLAEFLKKGKADKLQKITGMKGASSMDTPMHDDD